MPNSKTFATHEEYLKYTRDYREKNREKFRTYNREYNKKYRLKNGYKWEDSWHKENKEKVKIEYMFRKAVKNGLILKQPCEICKNENSQGHHWNYKKPFNILWLCPKHHKRVHILKIGSLGKKKLIKILFYLDIIKK